MATTLTTTARNAACNAVVDLLNSGTIQFLTAADGDLGSVTFPNPAFGDAATGVATAGTIVNGTVAAGGGTCTKYTAKTSGGTALFSGTVAKTSGGDINFDENVWAAGGTISVSAFTYTQPAS